MRKKISARFHPGIGRASVEILEPRQMLSAPGSQWKLVWGDEFNGNHLDTSKWSIGLPWTGDDGTNRHFNSSVLSYITDNDVAVSGGALHLLDQKQDVTDPSGNVFHYTQGMITSSGKFDMRYGYVEIRAQVPAGDGPGLWPVFWMLQPGWPPEDDVAEFLTSGNRFHQGLAYGSSDNVHWDDVNMYKPLPVGFHTYGMQWGPGYQIFNVDGHITHTSLGPYIPNDALYLLLNNGVEAAHPPTAATIFPNSFDVDYVRVYQRTGSPDITDGGFEGGAMGLWRRTSNVGVVAANPHSGTYSLQTHMAGSEGYQIITGLKPKTTYVLTGWGEVSDQATAARIGVSEYGGADSFASIQSTSYSPGSVVFTTAPGHTTAVVYGMVAAGSGWAWFDDFAIHQAAVIDNGGFESGATGAWELPPNALIAGDRPHRGRSALRESGADSVARQTIYGLAPNTTYRLSGWARSFSSNSAAVIGVTDSSGTAVSASVESTRYRPLYINFTTGPAQTTATVFCSTAIGTTAAWFDDLRLMPLSPKLRSSRAAAAHR